MAARRWVRESYRDRYICNSFNSLPRVPRSADVTRQIVKSEFHYLRAIVQDGEGVERGGRVHPRPADHRQAAIERHELVRSACRRILDEIRLGQSQQVSTVVVNRDAGEELQELAQSCLARYG